MAQTNNLSNINFMSKERFDSLTEIDDNQLYAVEFPFNDEDLVHTHSDEEINGEKSFKVSPIVPTISDTKDSSKKAASTEFVQNVANTKQDIATAVNYDNITNCITEIPQDIKLELNDGTLTLRAGSKLYIPNGVGKFDEKVFEQDVSVSSLGTVTGTYLLSYGQSAWSGNESVDYFNADFANLFSGPSQPTATVTNTMWYDTTNNVIKTTKDTGSTWVTTKNTFPFCVVNVTSGTITSIDQVFNGFGYISSTVFALPGIKGLVPNGRNEDGSLRNIKFTLNNVYIRTDDYPSNYTLVLSPNNLENFLTFKYDEDKNYNISSSGEILNYRMNAGTLIRGTNGVITSFQPKTSFHAIDYNDKATVVGWGMPDYSTSIQISNSQYVSGTVGDGYTAPYACILIGNGVDDSRSAFINECHVFYQNDNASGVNSQSPTFFLDKGDVFRSTSSFGWLQVIKLKGA